MVASPYYDYALFCIDPIRNLIPKIWSHEAIHDWQNSD